MEIIDGNNVTRTMRQDLAFIQTIRTVMCALEHLVDINRWVAIIIVTMVSISIGSGTGQLVSANIWNYQVQFGAKVIV